MSLHFVGPLVTMMGKMVKNMVYFVVLLLVVLMSFGVARQALLVRNSDPKWRILRDVRACCLYIFSLAVRFNEQHMHISKPSIRYSNA